MMPDERDSFVDSVPEIETATLVDEDAIFLDYTGRIRDHEGTVRIRTLRDEVVDDTVETAFRERAGEWYNSSTHPNIVTIHGRGRDPKPWIGTAPCRGDRLESVADDLSVGAVRELLADVASAVRNAGLYNTRHTHLEPAHVWVSKTDGEVTGRVSDWGLDWACRVATDTESFSPFTPPELVEDPNGGTERTDVYGLGAVAYYALTGEPPVNDDGTLETAVLDGERPPPTAVDSSLPDALDDVLLTAVARNPAQRHESAYTFRQAFTAAIPDDAPVRVPTLGTDRADSTPDGDRSQSGTRTTGDSNEPARERDSATSKPNQPAGGGEPNQPAGREREQGTQGGGASQRTGADSSGREGTETFYCNTCGTELTPALSYCPQCGEPNPLERADHPARQSPASASTKRAGTSRTDGTTVYCPSCGEEHDWTSSYCRACGTELKGTKYRE